jgi:hypothetical protein
MLNAVVQWSASGFVEISGDFLLTMNSAWSIIDVVDIASFCGLFVFFGCGRANYRDGDLAGCASSEGEHRVVFGKTAKLIAVIVTVFPPAAQILSAKGGDDTPCPRPGFAGCGRPPRSSLLYRKLFTLSKQIGGFFRLNGNPSAVCAWLSGAFCGVPSSVWPFSA